MSAMLFDMNKVFEDFIFESLRQRLPMTGSTRDLWLQGERLQLDREAVLRPEPDLSWWRGSAASSLAMPSTNSPRKDASQTSTSSSHTAQLPGSKKGLLVYAEQPTGPRDIRSCATGQSFALKPSTWRPQSRRSNSDATNWLLSFMQAQIALWGYPRELTGAA